MKTKKDSHPEISDSELAAKFLPAESPQGITAAFAYALRKKAGYADGLEQERGLQMEKERLSRSRPKSR